MPTARPPLFAGDPLLADAREIEGAAVRFGGIARQVLEHEQLRERAVKLLRSDFAVCDDFVATLGHTVTESDLVVCCGTDDVYTEDQVRAWTLSSTAETAVHWLSGGHFYLGEHTSALARLIGERLGSAAPAAGAVGAPSARDRGGS
ncbi:thioesterase II family protein [Streptomyces sp. PR69]|uniref:thioesterase II family protein n=1 Tax=Streptomyces sp. PR69 TaxID=2984950 RepID=UPI002264C77F|nr:thioesterase domain-containing protein [Streptomyces sp. PR69]